MRFIDECDRYKIFTDDIPQPLRSKAGFKVKGYTFAKELQLNDSFTDYFIHSDHFCPEYLVDTEPIVEALGKIEDAKVKQLLKEKLAARIDNLSFLKAPVIQSNSQPRKIEDNLPVEGYDLGIQSETLFFLFAIGGGHRSCLVFKDDFGNLYLCRDTSRFQLTHKPVLSETTRSIEHAISRNESLNQCHAFKVRNSSFLRCAREFAITCNEYDPAWTTTIVRFDIVDFESYYEIVPEKVKTKNPSELLNEQIKEFLNKPFEIRIRKP